MRTRTLLATILVTLIASSNAPAAPDAELWKFWDTHEETSDETIDHGAWGRFLAVHVKRDAAGINRVDYGSISPTERKRLDAYIERLAGVTIRRHSRAVQRAYWINLYNALTVQVVLDHYPVGSIGDIDISPGLFSNGPWGRKLITVEDKALSLDDIEHRILRPIWRDPRVHYAVNCASVGCPNLARQAYTASNLEALLDRQADVYINHPRGVEVTTDGLVVSRIYDWFVEDFGGTEQGVLDHLLEYANRELADAIRSGTGIDGYRYDWTINDR